MRNAYRSPHPQSSIAVHGARLAYVDTGPKDGPSVVFLHGNPTSSYLWRAVIDRLVGEARCLAPDLIGMGNSDPAPDGGYRFADHQRYLDAWFDAVCGDVPLILVGHDWGSALMFDWARRNPGRVRGIAYMEAIVGTRRWSDFPEGRAEFFQRMRGPEGEAMVLDQNFFVETMLPNSVQRTLSEEEMAVYRAPYPDRDSRLPTLVWPRELPIEGEPADVVDAVERYAAWMRETDLPKLFVNADPGAVIVGALREACREWPNQTEVTVPGIHFIQEDSAEPIGAALSDFIRRLGV